MEKYDTAIVGGGIAAYTAALTAKNLLLNYLWLGEEGFGKLPLAAKLTDFPADYRSGAEFAEAIRRQMEWERLTLTPLRADGIYKTGDGYLITAGDKTFSASTVILATGVERKGSLGGESEFLGRGVSYCAVCDGALYRGKTVAAVLSSPKFEGEAEYLARFAARLHLFCLYPEPRVTGENVILHSETPLSVAGGTHVERLLYRGGEISVDGVFLLKHSAPPAALVGGLKTEGAHVAVGRDLSTNLAGLYAAGDVTGRPYQYAKAAGEGCVAAHSVWEFLRERRTFS